MLKGMNGYVEEVDSDEDDHGTSINGKSPCNHDIRPRSPRSPGESFTYEHFPVVCPTCRGSGRVLEGKYKVTISCIMLIIANGFRS